MGLYRNIRYFEGLNSLRFFAAYLVLMHHAETIRLKNGLVNFKHLGLFQNGSNAVSFFFVLSGFLITYLLLKEHETTGKISIKRFYLKRILRIWPLYFLLFFIGVLFLPFCFQLLHVDYQMPYSFGQVWHYFVFFLPGLVTFYFGHHLLEPLWSIGVEEVFYLIWAPLFKFLKQHILLVLCFVILLKVLLTLASIYWISSDLVDFLINIFSFEAMAIGGLGAYFVFNRKEPISGCRIYKKGVQWVLYAVLLAVLIFHTNADFFIWNLIFKVPIFSNLLIYFLFLYLIIGVSLADNSPIKLRNKVLSFLGEISYGVYMYHLLVIFTMVLFVKDILLNMNPIVSSLIFYVLVSVGTISISYVSKEVFENRFLNLKNRLHKPI